MGGLPAYVMLHAPGGQASNARAAQIHAAANACELQIYVQMAYQMMFSCRLLDHLIAPISYAARANILS